MADEKTKVVTDTAGPDAGQPPTQPEAGGGAPAPKQEQPPETGGHGGGGRHVGLRPPQDT